MTPEQCENLKQISCADIVRIISMGVVDLVAKWSAQLFLQKIDDLGSSDGNELLHNVIL